jgi:hypothetical protein
MPFPNHGRVNRYPSLSRGARGSERRRTCSPLRNARCGRERARCGVRYRTALSTKPSDPVRGDRGTARRFAAADAPPSSSLSLRCDRDRQRGQRGWCELAAHDAFAVLFGRPHASPIPQADDDVIQERRRRCVSGVAPTTADDGKGLRGRSCEVCGGSAIKSARGCVERNWVRLPEDAVCLTFCAPGEMLVRVR